MRPAQDRSELVALYARHGPIVLRAILRVFEPDEAELAVHEVFARALEQVGACAAVDAARLYALTTQRCNERAGASVAAQGVESHGPPDELTLIRYEVEELDDSERQAVERQLAASESARLRLEQLREFVAHHWVEPPEHGPYRADAAEPGRPPPTRWAQLGRAVGMGAALAGALLLWGPTRPSTDRVWGVHGSAEANEAAVAKPAPKTRPFALHVRAHDGISARALTSGDRVYPGEVIKLTVSLGSGGPGELLVLGLDPEGEVYPLFPAQGGRSERIEISGAQLEAARALDQLRGAEVVVGLLCVDAFDFAGVATALARAGHEVGPELRAGCQQSIVRLNRGHVGELDPDPDGADAPDAFDPLGTGLDEDDRLRPPDAAVDDSQESGSPEDEEDAAGDNDPLVQ